MFACKEAANFDKEKIIQAVAKHIKYAHSWCIIWQNHKTVQGILQNKILFKQLNVWTSSVTTLSFHTRNDEKNNRDDSCNVPDVELVSFLLPHRKIYLLHSVTVTKQEEMLLRAQAPTGCLQYCQSSLSAGRWQPRRFWAPNKPSQHSDFSLSTPRLRSLWAWSCRRPRSCQCGEWRCPRWSSARWCCRPCSPGFWRRRWVIVSVLAVLGSHGELWLCTHPFLLFL